VRRAYHRLAKLWHPDRFMHAPESLGERAGRRMRTLTAAYAVLGNAEERHAYDARRGLDAGTDDRHGEVPLVFQRDTSVWGIPLGFGSASPDPTMGRRGNPDGGHVFFALLAGTVLLGVTYYALRNNGSQNGGILAFGIALLLLIVLIWALSSSDGGQIAGGMGAAPATAPADRESPAAADPEAPEAPPRTAFERLVDDALADVPERFQPYLENVVVQVEPEPTQEDLESVGVREGGLLLGLYHGVNLTRHSVFGASGPEEITIFQHPIEQYCHGDPERIRHQVLATVLHELAHHFGLEHEDMPGWVK
jgi:predicted Zn-dependent protease with MMP-like domain